MRALLLLCGLLLGGVAFGQPADDAGGVPNGGFARRDGALAQGWSPVGAYEVLPRGGPGGAPCLAMRSDGATPGGAVQVLRWAPARSGAFAVTARMQVGDVAEGGDCCLWLDVIQEDGTPIWGMMGLPDRTRRGWQTVRAEVWPSKPVREVQVFLLLRGTRGAVRFADVRLAAAQPSIREMRAWRAAEAALDVTAELSHEVEWTLTGSPSGGSSVAKSGRSTSPRARLPWPQGASGILTLRAGPTVRTLRVPTANRGGRASVWAASPMVRVFEDDLPPADGRADCAMEAARGEAESVQLCVRARRPLRDLRVDVATPPSGPGAVTVDCRRVGFVWVGQSLRHPLAARREACWWPDPLLAPTPVSLEADTTQPFWLTLRVPRNARPGLHVVKVAVRDAEGLVGEATVRLRVHSVVLPVRGHMRTAFALMDGFMRKLYGTVTPAVRRAYTDYLLDHRINPDDISRTSTPDLDELSYARDRGLNAFNILNAVPEPERPVTWTCFAELKDYTPEFKATFLNRLDAVAPELERRGLLDLAYVYGFDERPPEFIPVITDLFGAIKRRHPRIKTVSTCWPPAGTDPLAMNIDCFVPLSSSYDPKVAASARARGGEVWWYVCMGPGFPYANWLFDNPLIEARVIWWQAFAYDVEGFLYWGLNIWERAGNDHLIPDDSPRRIDWSVSSGGDYSWLQGDGELIYAGANGPIGSLRMEAIRDGLEDFELLRLAAPAGKQTPAEATRPVTADRSHYTRDPAVLSAARRAQLKAASHRQLGQ
jgi:hypothetical protein